MSAAFTPGPWEWWDDGVSLVRITEAAEQKLVCQAILPSNARLIAAAPELYEALELALDLIGDRGSLTSTTGMIRSRGRAALAKARGEQ